MTRPTVLGGGGVGMSTVRVTIEKFWARSGREVGEKWERTFTNFDRGNDYFRHLGVQESRINNNVYGESSHVTGSRFVYDLRHDAWKDTYATV